MNNTTSLFELLDEQFDQAYIVANIWKTLIVVVSLIVCFVTTLGNLLVLYSFKVNRKLRTTNNYFLFSLAIADLMIGIISMPISTMYFITDGWLLGPIVCDLWLSLDYTVSNASVANLLLISFDRYFSITRPLTYRVNRTAKKVITFIALSWIVSILIWTPFILAWPFINGKRTINDNECRVQFLYTNKYITLSTAFAAFYFPVIVLSIVYFKIWRETKKRHIELRKLQGKSFISSNKVNQQALSTTTTPTTTTTTQSNMALINGTMPTATIAATTTTTTNQMRNHQEIINENEEFKITNEKSKIKNFLTNLVDNEDEEELNEHSIGSNESTANRNFSLDNNESKFYRHSKKYKKRNESATNCCFYYYLCSSSSSFSSCFCCFYSNNNFDQNKCENKRVSRSYSLNSREKQQHGKLFQKDEYTPVKIVYRSTNSTSNLDKCIQDNSCSNVNNTNGSNENKTNLKKQVPSTCQYCKTQFDPAYSSYYKIVIQLPSNEQQNELTSQQIENSKLQIKEYPLNANDFDQIKIENVCEVCKMHHKNSPKKRMSKKEQERVNIKRRSSSVSTNMHKLSTKSNQTMLSQNNDSRKQRNQGHNMNKSNGNIAKQRQYQADSRKLVKKQDQKAAKTLSAILLAFIITWTPYNINVVVNTFCNNCLHQFEKWDSFGNF